VNEGVPFTKALDPNKCAFGQWFNEFKTRDTTLQEILTQFNAPHKHIHSLAEKLLELRDKGKKDEALECLRVEKITTLRRLQALFRQSREQVKSAMRPVIIFVTEDGLVPKFGIVIDEINNIIEYDANSIQSNIGIKSLSGKSNLFSGIYVGEDGVDSIICNIDGIIPH
jgi:purine-binding chemotaxis protein CheW